MQLIRLVVQFGLHNIKLRSILVFCINQRLDLKDAEIVLEILMSLSLRWEHAIWEWTNFLCLDVGGYTECQSLKTSFYHALRG
jgi:hypothetical protein